MAREDVGHRGNAARDFPASAEGHAAWLADSKLTIPPVKFPKTNSIEEKGRRDSAPSAMKMRDAFLHGRIFALLSSMYVCKPTSEVLANGRRMLKEEPLAGAEELSQTLAVIVLVSEQELEDILWDYTRLFIGPDRLPCPPLESVYTSHKRLMMQDAFVDVQQFCSRVGVEIDSADVMPDHIGAELKLPIYSF